MITIKKNDVIIEINSHDYEEMTDEELKEAKKKEKQEKKAEEARKAAEQKEEESKVYVNGMSGAAVDNLDSEYGLPDQSESGSTNESTTMEVNNNMNESALLETMKMDNEPSNLFAYLKKVYKPKDFSKLTEESIDKAKSSSKLINKEWIGYTKEWMGQNDKDDKIFNSKIKAMEKLSCVKIWDDGGGTELGLDIKSNRIYCFDHDYGFINSSISIKQALSLKNESVSESSINDREFDKAAIEGIKSKYNIKDSDIIAVKGFLKRNPDVSKSLSKCKSTSDIRKLMSSKEFKTAVKEDNEKSSKSSDVLNKIETVSKITLYILMIIWYLKLNFKPKSVGESTLLSEDSEESIPVTDDSAKQPDTNIEAVSESNNTSMLVVLNSLLRVYCSNFSVLHWNSVGEEFNDAHRNIAEEYEELCHKYVDPIAEMVTRLGSNPLNYVEVIELMNSSERKCLIVDSKRLYTRKDIIEIASKMFTDIVELLSATIESEELKAPINAGIRSELESILNDFDLQYRYINKRRLSIENQNIGTNESINIREEINNFKSIIDSLNVLKENGIDAKVDKEELKRRYKYIKEAFILEKSEVLMTKEVNFFGTKVSIPIRLSYYEDKPSEKLLSKVDDVIKYITSTSLYNYLVKLHSKMFDEINNDDYFDGKTIKSGTDLANAIKEQINHKNTAIYISNRYDAIFLCGEYWCDDEHGYSIAFPGGKFIKADNIKNVYDKNYKPIATALGQYSNYM